LSKDFRRCRDAGTRTRYLSAFKLDAGRKPEVLADYLGVHRDTAYRVARRFRERGEPGLLDGRANNGPDKLTAVRTGG
jgi:transposase